MGQQLSNLKGATDGYVAVDTDGGDDYWNATPGRHAGFLDGMLSNEMPREGFEYLALWDSRDVGGHLKSVILTPNDAFDAVTWFCTHVNDVREDSNVSWSRVWRALCDVYRLVVSGQSNELKSLNEEKDPLFLERTDCLRRTIRKSFTCEFMHLARVMPTYLGYPLIQALQDTARALRFDILEHLLSEPEEGLFLLWYGTFWHYKGGLGFGKLKIPSIEKVVYNILMVRTSGNRKTLKSQKTVMKFSGPATAATISEKPIKSEGKAPVMSRDETNDLASVLALVQDGMFESTEDDEGEEKKNRYK